MRHLFLCLMLAAVTAVGSIGVSAQESQKAIKGGILNGKAISLPKPEYPIDAKAAGVQGVVRVEVLIDESGTVISAKAIKEETTDNELATETVDAMASLRNAAERAALEARFSPTLLSGRPVKVSGVITYSFVRSEVADHPDVVKGGVLNGKAIELPPPAYPAAAKAVKAMGTVVVEVIVNEGGQVIAASAVSGHPLLQAAAVAAARSAKFEPAFLNGAAVKFSGVITYNFVLPEKEQQ